MNKQITVKRDDNKGFILVKPDGKQFTSNEFNTRKEANDFLDKLVKHAGELMAAHEADRKKYAGR